MLYSTESLERMTLFYQKVNAFTQHLSKIHSDRLQCKIGCSGCCIDDLEVFGIEAAYISKHFPEILTSKPHDTGKCAFLDSNGACRIYDARPLICRSHGLPIRFVETDENNQTTEFIDICELNENETPLDKIKKEDFWNENLFSEVLVSLELEANNKEINRVRLRDLFSKV